MRKIYVASSWKNKRLCNIVAAELRRAGHTVDCFCDGSTGRYVFHWTEFVDREEDLMNYDAIEFISDPRTIKAFEEDKKHLDWADTVLLILPSGRSAHLEAGYGKGQGKGLFIYGDFRKGEFDVMYRFADGMYRLREINKMVEDMAINVKHSNMVIECDRCDGVGWYEGGEALQTQCEECGGTGVIDSK